MILDRITRFIIAFTVLFLPLQGILGIPEIHELITKRILAYIISEFTMYLVRMVMRKYREWE